MVIFSESQSVGVLRHHWSICHPSSVCFPACSDFKPCRAACCDGSVSVSVCRNGHKPSKMFLVWTEPTVLFFTVPAGDGQRREELLPGHTQTDQEENQRVQALPPGPLQQLHGLAGRSGADGQVERSSSLFWTLCCSLCQDEMDLILERLSVWGQQNQNQNHSDGKHCVSSRTFQTLLDISLVPLLPVNTSCLYSVSEILSWSCCQLSSVFWMANMYFLNISMIETAWSSSGGCFSFSRMKISSQRCTAEFDHHTVSQDVFQILT